jgi:hypothetical protein
MTTHPACGKTWTGARFEHCPECCETFSGADSGDRHRTGTFDPLDRRCLSADEMREIGLRLIGGVWRGKAAPEELRAKWRAMKTGDAA